MNPEDLTAMTWKICNIYCYPLPASVTLNRRLRTTLGKCFDDGRIELNEWIVLHNKEEVVEALLKHEIAHLRHFNHHKEFKYAVKIMGSAEYIEDLFTDMVFPPNVKKASRRRGCKWL